MEATRDGSFTLPLLDRKAPGWALEGSRIAGFPWAELRATRLFPDRRLLLLLFTSFQPGVAMNRSDCLGAQPQKSTIWDRLANLRGQRPWGWGWRYGLAALAIAAAFGMRVALESRFGPGLPPYLTFYPAAMATAVLAGFGPGLLATALAGLAASYWILPPVGRFAIASPADRLGLMVFLGMGLFLSIVAERNRQDGKVFRWFGTNTDISEREQAEVELMDARTRAELNAAEVVAIMDAMPAAVFVAHDSVEARFNSRRKKSIWWRPFEASSQTIGRSSTRTASRWRRAWLMARS